MFGLVPYINKPVEPNPIYNQNYWNNLGGNAALDLPLFGPGTKQDYSSSNASVTFNGSPKFTADYVQLDGTSSFLSTTKTFSSSPPVWYSTEVYIPSTSLACIILDDSGGVTSSGENNGMGIGIGSGNGNTVGNNLLIPFWGVSWQDTGILLGTGWVSLDIILTKDSKAIAYINGQLKFTGTSVMLATAATLGRFMIGADAQSSNRRYANIRVRRSHVLHFEPSADQIADFNARPWSRFSYQQNIFYQPPSSGTTINLTSKSFIFSSSNAQESVLRPLNSQTEDQSESQANISITRPLNSSTDSQSFVTTATSSIARALNSKFTSQTESKAQESIQRVLSSSIIIDQSFAQGKLTFGAIINLQSKVSVQSLSQVHINLDKALNSKSFDFTSLLAEINVKQNLSSKSTGQSKSTAQETITRPLSAKQINQSESLAELSVQRLLDSNSIAQSLSKCSFTTQLYTHMQLTCFRRYSSQYFVQSGSVEDDGQ